MITAEHVDMIVGFTINFFNIESDLLKEAYEKFKQEILDQKTGYICAPFVIGANGEPVLLLLEFSRVENRETFFIVSDVEEMEEDIKNWQSSISQIYQSFPCRFSHKLFKSVNIANYLEKTIQIFAPHKSNEFSHIS